MIGSGSDIGHATALRLSAEGTNEIAEKIIFNDGLALPYRVDVSVECEVLDMITPTISLHGRINFLVHNVNITSQVPLSELNKVTEEV